MWPFSKKSEVKTPPRPTGAKPSGVKKLLGYLVARGLTAQYDALRWRDTRLRPRPEIRTDFSETEQVFSAERRIEAYALADDLMDNCTVGSTVATAVRLTVGTFGGTPLFEGETKESDNAFFRRWAADCGFAEDENLQEILQLILRMVKVHGDCLVLCDETTGYKVRLWDADQIVNISDFEAWKRQNGLPEDARQIEGVVINGEGRVLGYMVTMLRNTFAVNSKDASFIEAGRGKRVSYRRKHTQYRGEPSIIAAQEITADTKELMKSEIGAAKLASELSLIVEQPPGIDATGIGGILQGIPANELTEGTDITDEDIASLAERTADDAKTFKAYEGHAAIASVASGTKVTNLNNSTRPATTIQAWMDRLDDVNGKALGMMSCLSRGRADNSYSSGQIEVEISWQAFKEDQRMLSEVVDYFISALMPWADYTLRWPEAFSIDPEKDEKVIDMRLRGGRASFRDVLGPDYEAKLKQLAKEKKLLEELGLNNLAFFQSPAGAVVPTEVKEEVKEGEA